MHATHEHEFEAAHGLPEPLPPGERLLWQGAPSWQRLAVDALHLRKVALYFGALLAWHAGSGLHDGTPLASLVWSAVPTLLLGGFALALLAAIAVLAARTTVYTLTDRRVVMRVGIVLSVTFNLPLSRVDGASLHRRADGRGDVALQLGGPDRIAYLHLWPHARPWHLRRPQPMLRALPDAERVAGLLGDALAASAGQARQPLPVTAMPSPASPPDTSSARPLAA